MGEVVWGELAKEVQDKTTVDEEIDSKILTHNLDPSGHGQANESVYEHRIAEILDHLDASIIAAKLALNSVTTDKIFIDKFFYLTNFDSSESFVKTLTGLSVITNYFGKLFISAEGAVNSYAKYQPIDGSQLVNFATQDPTFRLSAFIYSGQGEQIYFGLGAEDTSFAGFKIVNGVLYACTRQISNEYLTEIEGIAFDELHKFEVLHEHGDNDTFIIDDVPVHVESDHPANASSNNFFTFKAKLLSGDQVIFEPYLLQVTQGY